MTTAQTHTHPQEEQAHLRVIRTETSKPTIATVLSVGMIRIALFGLILVLASAIISTTASYDLILSASRLVLMVAGLALGFVLTALIIKRDNCNLPAVTHVVSLLGLILALYFLLQNHFDLRSKFEVVRELSRLWQGSVPDLDLYKPHPNPVAMALEISLPFSIVSVRSNNRVSRWISVISTIICVYALFMTESRGAWFAIAIGLGLTTLGFVYHCWKQGQCSGRTLFAVGAAAVAGGAVLIIGLAVISLSQPALIRSITDRLSLYHNALGLVIDYPYTGAGMGVFNDTYTQYVLFYGAPPQIHAHNLWLDLTIGQGMGGLIGYGLVTLATIWAILKALRSRAEPTTMFWLTLLVWLSLQLHTLCDDPFYPIPLMVLLVCSMMLLAHSATLAPANGQGWSLRSKALVIASFTTLGASGLAVFWLPVVSLAQSNLGNVYQAKLDIGADRSSATLASTDEWLTSSWHTWPQNPSAVRRAAFFYLNQRQLDRAIAYHRETGAALNVWPKISYEIAYHQGDFAFARLIEKAILDQVRTSHLSYYQITYCTAPVNQWAREVVTNQPNVLRLANPPSSTQYARLGTCQLNSRDKAHALNPFVRERQLDPGNGE